MRSAEAKEGAVAMRCANLLICPVLLIVATACGGGGGSAFPGPTFAEHERECTEAPLSDSERSLVGRQTYWFDGEFTELILWPDRTYIMLRRNSWWMGEWSAASASRNPPLTLRTEYVNGHRLASPVETYVDTVRHPPGRGDNVGRPKWK